MLDDVVALSGRRYEFRFLLRNFWCLTTLIMLSSLFLGYGF